MLGRISKSFVGPTVRRLNTAIKMFYQYSTDKQGNISLFYNEVKCIPQNEIKLWYTKYDIVIPIVLYHVSQVYVRKNSTGKETKFL